MKDLFYKELKKEFKRHIYNVDVDILKFNNNIFSIIIRRVLDDNLENIKYLDYTYYLIDLDTFKILKNDYFEESKSNNINNIIKINSIFNKIINMNEEFKNTILLNRIESLKDSSEDTEEKTKSRKI